MIGSGGSRSRRALAWNEGLLITRQTRQSPGAGLYPSNGDSIRLVRVVADAGDWKLFHNRYQSKGGGVRQGAEVTGSDSND